MPKSEWSSYTSLGEKFNFNRDIIPSNSTDKTYSVGGGMQAAFELIAVPVESLQQLK